MKKLLHMALALALVLGLAACGGAQEEAAWAASDVQALLDSGAFSEELEELDADTAFILYQLAGRGLSQEQLVEAAVRRSAGATCEEIAYLALDSEASAQSAQGALEDYVQNQIDENVDYRPAEIPKLEGAYIAVKGRTVLLVVASDIDAARKALA